ncbi:MAG TPA: hypothetical protein VG738_19705 [Chitinophagaceae bacterium]|nr:hypothetical protein [Chitinophagaceae bacterium]
MRIEEQDSLEVYYFLQYEQERGMEWMLYKEQNNAVTVQGMFCFASQEDIGKFCKQYPVFTEGFKTAGIALVIENLKDEMLVGEELQAAQVDIKIKDERSFQPEVPHVRPYELTRVVQAAVAAAVGEGKQWVAYNTTFRVLDAEDLFFAKSAAEAGIFAKEKTNNLDCYSVRQFDSVHDFLVNISQINEPNYFIEQKTNNMNNENVDFLHNQVKYAGFGEELHGALVKEIKNDPGEFKLSYSHTFGKDTMDAELNFKRSKESDLYFFNSYDVTMKREGKPDMRNTFYINQGQSITLREAYNLMNGRAVEKELTRKMTPEEKEQYKAEFKLDKSQRGQPENWEKAPTYKAWIKLDLDHRDNNGNLIQKQYHENFGFKLEDALAKLPLRKMDASQMHDMISSLKKGNITPVQFTVEGVDKKMHLAADPQFKAITVYDDKMQLAKKETYSQNTKKDLVAGPEAPWEEKKTDVGKAAKEGQDVAKKDLLGKGKEKNGLLPQKEKKGESKKMKIA